MSNTPKNLKKLKDKLNYSASPLHLVKGSNGPSPKKTDTPKDFKRSGDNDNVGTGRPVTTQSPRGGQPAPSREEVEAAQKSKLQRAQQAAAARQQIKPAVEYSRIGDEILVRKEITPEKEILTKYDFENQTMSKETYYHVGGGVQLKPNFEDVPFEQKLKPIVQERLRNRLIEAGGSPSPLLATEAERKKNAPPARRGYQGTRIGFTANL